MNAFKIASMFLLSFFLFLIGLATPIILLAVFIVYFAYANGSSVRKERKKVLRKSSKRAFVYGTQATIQWLNKIVSKAYPHLINPKIVSYIINSQIPNILSKTPRIEKLELVNVAMSQQPPVIKHARLVTGLDIDHVVVSFFFTPKFIVNANSVIRYIGTFSVNLKGTLDSVDGGIAIKLPKNYGNAKVVIEKSTSMMIDIDANVANVVTINTEVLGSIWASLTDTITSLIRSYVPEIPIEQLLYRKKKENNKDKKKIFKIEFKINNCGLFPASVM